MALKINRVPLKVIRARPEEVIESDFEQRRCRGIGGDVAANVVFHSIRAHHHRQGIPANQTLDPSLEFLIPGKWMLLVDRDCVRVRRVGRKKSCDSGWLSVGAEPLEDVAHDFGAAVPKHFIERLYPLLDLDRFQLRNSYLPTIVHSFAFIRHVQCPHDTAVERCEARPISREENIPQSAPPVYRRISHSECARPRGYHNRYAIAADALRKFCSTEEINQRIAFSLSLRHSGGAARDDGRPPHNY